MAILAELVAWRHTRPASAAERVEAVDPVCGMTVSIAGARESVVHEGRTYYFCGSGCRSASRPTQLAISPRREARKLV